MRKEKRKILINQIRERRCISLEEINLLFVKPGDKVDASFWTFTLKADGFVKGINNAGLHVYENIEVGVNLKMLIELDLKNKLG